LISTSDEVPTVYIFLMRPDRACRRNAELEDEGGGWRVKGGGWRVEGYGFTEHWEG
jgi:hypothetical protein